MSSLNLRHSVVADFWSNRDPHMGLILKWRDDMEDWGLDEDPSFSEALYDLVSVMERAARPSMIVNMDPLLHVMAYMSSSRAIRMLEWFDERYQQGLSIDLIERARQQPNNPRHQILLDRLRALQSMSLLSKVFTPPRTRFIADLLREGSNSTQESNGRTRF